ncbi:helix-turn-helix domain-containing protein [Enterococcus pallens]|uniref:Mga helix-turn-helix domain-containing protein n=1 Tax=Enterococcus pallens ATCC BAA-351 TaxID=1158607 RepID=R2SQ70_9ENTE|nr:helix-turn-helix domain-containing protein [Enterococcus pallens]EOH97385.1 hypothetical protein UAU_00053 [Enterococcus pallens ATCC BAA-351]EOU21196.1 hypothetical protein I588_02043 [Enterococcus pallens ATCC BAA-351]OJG80599.1 hypothetical protein RV10_GL004336 [Enterococcus pallens]
MESILLSEDAKKKIRIVNLLNNLDSGIYTTHYIASVSPFSKQTALYLLDSISDDLAELFGYHLFGSNRRITGGGTIDTNRYHQFLIYKSVPYQFILFILLNPRKTLDDFCTQLFMSTSSVRRLLKPFLTFLETFDIKINLASMKIEGNEYEIRLAFNALLWIGSSGKDILEHDHFRQKHIEVLKKIGFWDSPFINNNELLTLLTIAQLRMENNCPVDSFPVMNNHLPKQETKILTEYLRQFLPDASQLPTELNFLVYCLYYKFLAFDAQDMRIHYLEEFIRMEKERSDDKFWLLFDELIHLVKAKTQMNTNEFLTVSSNLSAILLGFYFNHRPLPDKNEIARHETVFPHIYQASFPFIQAFTKKVARRKGLGWITNVSDELAACLSYVVKPYLYEKKKVIVAITPLPNFILMRTLAEFLASFSFVEVVYRDKNDPAVDLFISTFQSFIPETSSSTFLVDIRGVPDGMKEQLFKKLYAIYQKKNRQ